MTRASSTGHSLGIGAAGRLLRHLAAAAVVLPMAVTPAVSLSGETQAVAAASAPASASAPEEATKHPGFKVDTAGLPVPPPGVSSVMLTPPGTVPPRPAPGDWEHGGAFRLLCNWSKMSFDDPIVFPGQPGKSHHHTFFGNTAVDAYTTSENIRSRGKASCRGGTINLSGYWVPTMVDTSTHKPVVPKALLIYYKTGLWPYMNDGSIMQPVPKGLKMIAGEATRATPGGRGSFACLTMATGSNRSNTGDGESIPTKCVPGEDDMRMAIPFPQCWDGKNLDSPDHKSHMAYPELNTVPGGWTAERQYRCPRTHPVVLPEISFIVEYDVTPTSNPKTWRLASDTYDTGKPGGYSRHGDWINGWDPDISDLWGVKCLRERRDCGSANMGDGRSTMEFQGN